LPGKELRPHTFVALFGLLACTGLRVSEALKLTRLDVDWDQGVLTIRMTKFRKSRLVPIHPSTALAMREYAKLRDRFHPLPETDSFFVATQGKALSYSTAENTFIRYLRPQLSWSPKNGGRAPRIHDLRHTFACRRLLQWYKQGVNIDHSIAALATYLGHVEVRDTYWYLTGVPELFALVGARFEQFAKSKHGDRS
jgi:integrase